MAGSVVGRLAWSLQVDADSHRTYSLTELVRMDTLNQGPLNAHDVVGLAQVGSAWNYGGDYDAYATCWPTKEVKVYRKQPKNEPGYYWEITSKFSTKPIRRCQDERVENPLIEPQRVSGSFTKFTKEAFFERADKPVDPGKAILSSSHEKLSVEVDDNRPNVTIGQTVATLELDLFSEMVDTVNDAELWGLPARCIKLSNVSWKRHYWGLCDVYYTRDFEFDIDFNTFDYEIADSGTRHLKKDGDKTKIENFQQNKDWTDENLGTRMPLDGDGNVAENRDDIHKITPEYYEESDFLQLGIPTTL